VRHVVVVGRENCRLSLINLFTVESYSLKLVWCRCPMIDDSRAEQQWSDILCCRDSATQDGHLLSRDFPSPLTAPANDDVRRVDAINFVAHSIRHPNKMFCTRTISNVAHRNTLQSTRTWFWWHHPVIRITQAYTFNYCSSALRK